MEKRIVDGKYRWDAAFKTSRRRYELSSYGTAVHFSIAVDARITDSDNKMLGAGLVFGSGSLWQYECRASERSRFWLGKYNLKENTWSTLADGPTPSQFNPLGWNRLRVVVEDAQVRCYLNDQWLAEIRDPDFLGDAVGMAVASEGDTGANGVVDFDNFEFRRRP